MSAAQAVIVVSVQVVVVGAAAPAHVLVHATQRAPVVGERDDELDALVAGGLDDLVEVLQPVGAVVVRGSRAVPVLEVDAVLLVVHGSGVVLGADVEERPGQACVLP